MNINTNNPVFNKDLFYLNDENVPSDQNKFHDGLTFLANKALEALKQPDEVEWAFQQIEKLNTQKLSSNNINTQVQTIFQKWIKIQLGDKSRYIPKEHLQKHCGKKFQGQFTTNMKDKRSRTLELSPPEGVNISDITPVVREGFLSYLQTGVVSDDAVEENVMSLIGIAYRHQVDSLVEHCSSLIQENLDDENLEIVLEFIKNRHLPSLRWACLEFMHSKSIKHQDKLTEEDQEILNHLKALPHTLELRMSAPGKLKVIVTRQLENSDIDHLEKIDKKFPISYMHFSKHKAGMPIINKMSQKFDNIEELIINDLSFGPEHYANIQKQFPKLTAFGNDAHTLSNFDDVKVYLKQFRNPDVEDASSKKTTLRSINLSAIHNLTDPQLEKLTPYLQEIYHLSINSDKITKLIVPKASIVNCRGCTSLETLQANQAITVKCDGCTSLKTIQATKAENVYCGGCTNLETLQANQAKTVKCDGCTSLKTLQINQAEEVNCFACTNLETLEAIQAEWVNCRGCTSLETLQINQAKEVCCDGCTNLKTLQANKAENVYCSGCTNLETLQANQAKIVDYVGCTNLVTIQTNQAETAYCDGFTRLKTLQANKVKNIYCDGCRNLETLEANQAERVCFRGCTNLKTLQANQAQEVNCSHLTRLKTLQANQAREINCDGCTNLETLEANQALKVYCEGFTRLKTLQANQAKDVYCRGCTSLVTLQANQAKDVYCRGCTSLVTLQANQAKDVYCPGCTSLETLEANQAKDVCCRGCTSLETLQANQAIRIDCVGCTSLKTLQAIKANRVDCVGCTSLKTLQANKANFVNCIGCTNLETLQANQAKEVHWYGCTSLTIFKGTLLLLPFNIAIRVVAYRFYLWVYHLFTGFIDLFSRAKTLFSPYQKN